MSARDRRVKIGKKPSRPDPRDINFLVGHLRRLLRTGAGIRAAADHLGQEAVIKEALKLSVADIRNQNLATTGALLGKLMAIAMQINSRQSAELFALLVPLFARARAIVESKAKIYDPEPEPSSAVPETDDDETQEPPTTVVPETDESDVELDLPQPKPKPKEPIRSESVANILAEMPLSSQDPGGFTLNPENNALSDDDDKAPPLLSSPMNTQEFINAFLPNKK